jgi:hypothetical protein
MYEERIVLSVRRLFTLLITSLVYFSHYIVRSSSIYGFLITTLVYCGHCIVHTSSMVYFGHCIVRTSSVVSFGHCIVRTSSVIYCGHCIVRTSSVIYFGHCIVRTSSVVSFGHCIVHTSSVISFGHCIVRTSSMVYFGHCFVRTSSIYDLWLRLWYILVILLSVLRLFTAYDYSFGIVYSLYCPCSVYLRLLITSLVYFGHCIVRTSSIYCFWLFLWYILVIVLCVLRLFTASDYFFGIFWSLFCPYFVYLLLLITSLVYFGHCFVRTSSIYGFWWLLWYILVIVLFVRRLFTLLITPLVYFGHCIVRTSSIYGFWLLLWYSLVIVLSVLRLFTAYDYSFGIFWSLYCPYFVYLRLLVTS